MGPVSNSTHIFTSATNEMIWETNDYILATKASCMKYKNTTSTRFLTSSNCIKNDVLDLQHGLNRDHIWKKTGLKRVASIPQFRSKHHFFFETLMNVMLLGSTERLISTTFRSRQPKQTNALGVNRCSNCGVCQTNSWQCRTGSGLCLALPGLDCPK